MGAVGLRSLGLADLGMSLGWVCEPMNVQNRVSDLLRLIHTTYIFSASPPNNTLLRYS